MQQQQRGFSGITRLSIENLNVANSDRPIVRNRISGHRDRETAQKSDCCKGCGERHMGISLVGDWPSIAQVFEPKINYFPPRQLPDT